MVIKVYVSLISFSQEVKKNQQRALMILESKNVPFMTIDITDPGSEDAKDYMNENARPKGNNKVPMTPQIFNDAEYCGDFEELDMANECDTLGEFLKMTDEEKKKIKIGITSVSGEDKGDESLTNGVSAEKEVEAAAAPTTEATPDAPQEEDETRDTNHEEAAPQDSEPVEAAVEEEAVNDEETNNAEVEEEGKLEEEEANEEENAEEEEKAEEEEEAVEEEEAEKKEEAEDDGDGKETTEVAKEDASKTKEEDMNKEETEA